LDGSYSSFVDWATGNLALRSLKTGETRRLTKDGTWKKPMEFVLNSVISPDNKLVAYSWYNPQEMELSTAASLPGGLQSLSLHWI